MQAPYSHRLNGVLLVADGIGHRVLARLGLLVYHFFPRWHIQAYGLVGLFLSIV